MRLKALIASLEKSIGTSIVNQETINLVLELAEAVQGELDRMSPVKDNSGKAEEWHH